MQDLTYEEFRTVFDRYCQTQDEYDVIKEKYDCLMRDSDIYDPELDYQCSLALTACAEAKRVFADMYLKHCHDHALMTNYVIRRDRELNPRLIYQMFTFTLDFKKKAFVDNKDYSDDEIGLADKKSWFTSQAKAYVLSSVRRSEKLSMKHFEYVEEYHENGNAHWHVLIGSERSVPPDAFRTYKNTYGFIQKSKDTSDTPYVIQDYLNKTGVSIRLL